MRDLIIRVLLAEELIENEDLITEGDKYNKVVDVLVENVKASDYENDFIGCYKYILSLKIDYYTDIQDGGGVMNWIEETTLKL